MWEYVHDHTPREILITPVKAYVTPFALERIDLYESTYPTSPSVGRIWRDLHRICWVIPDPDDVPENPSFVLHRKVPYELVKDAASISYMRRLMGLDNSSVLVNTSPPPQFLGSRTMDETEAHPTPKLFLVSVTLTVPEDALEAVNNLIRPVVENFRTVRADGFNVSVQPYEPDPEE